jgi:glycogen operon protein
LNDLVSYNDKHNESNGEENRDGHSDNKSWNCGTEGPTGDDEVRALRERQKRNLLATLLLSQGTPMVVAGDEFGRTQAGNNNAYCQDNEISWVDWEAIDADGHALTDFVHKLTRLRHALPVLRRGRFLVGEYNEALQVTDVTWISPDGDPLSQEQWDDPAMRCFGMVIDGRAQATGIRRPASDATLLIVVNAHHDVVDFTLPEIPGSQEWTCLIDTNMPVRDELPEFGSCDVYQVTGRSLLLFALQGRGRTQNIVDRLAENLVEDSEIIESRA